MLEHGYCSTIDCSTIIVLQILDHILRHIMLYISSIDNFNFTSGLQLYTDHRANMRQVQAVYRTAVSCDYDNVIEYIIDNCFHIYYCFFFNNLVPACIRVGKQLVGQPMTES